MRGIHRGTSRRSVGAVLYGILIIKSTEVLVWWLRYLPSLPRDSGRCRDSAGREGATWLDRSCPAMPAQGRWREHVVCVIPSLWSVVPWVALPDPRWSLRTRSCSPLLLPTMPCCSVLACMAAARSPAGSAAAVFQRPTPPAAGFR